MTIYIAFLRGINVGGHNKIKMTDLKLLLESMGCKTCRPIFKAGMSCLNLKRNQVSCIKCLN